MVIFSIGSEFVVAVAVFLTLRMVAGRTGAVGFGAYSIARRTLAVITYPLLLGLYTSLPRYLARSDAEDSSAEQRRNLIVAALAVAAPVLTAFVVTTLSLPGQVAIILFGSASFRGLVGPLVLATIGLYLHTLVYAYYRGRLRMWTAGSMQVLNLAVVPPVAVLVGGASIDHVLIITGTGWVLAAAGFGLPALLELGPFGRHPLRDASESIRELLRFGVPRLPGEVALFGLFALPTVLVAHTSGVAAAGFLSFGLALVQGISSIFVPVGTLMLPYISRLAARREWPRIRNLVTISLLGSVATALVLVVLLELVLGEAVRALLGDRFAAAVEPARWLLAGAVGYQGYILLRNPLDALFVHPHNSVNLTIALLLMTAMIWFGGRIVRPDIAVFMSLTLVGALSYVSWRRGFDGLSNPTERTRT